MKNVIGLTLALTTAAVAPALADASAPSLRGSPAAMVQQNQVAKQHGLAFYRTAAEINAAVDRGELVRLNGDANYDVADFVSFPYLQPEAHLFVERLAAQYREACGQKLVVTSGVRPTSGQPSNSHQLSVHPAGMAVDLRVSDRESCRSWLESAILNMESQGLINGIREYRPPHYHIAVFPTQYREYAIERIALEEQEARSLEAQRLAQANADAAASAATAALLEAAGLNALAPTQREKDSSKDTFLLAALVFVALPLGLGVVFRRVRGR